MSHNNWNPNNNHNHYGNIGLPPPPPPPPPPQATYSNGYYTNAQPSIQFPYTNINPPPPPPPPPPASYSNYSYPYSQPATVYPPPPPAYYSTISNATNITPTKRIQNYSTHPSNNNNKKQKFNETNPQHHYTCPNCPNVSFPSQKALTNHISTHITCKHPGCTYIASKKLVNAHYAKHHGQYSGSGFKKIQIQLPGHPTQRFKVCVGDDPEDIQKWIAERKRNFPTRQRRLEVQKQIEEGGVCSFTSKPKWADAGKEEGDIMHDKTKASEKNMESIKEQHKNIKDDPQEIDNTTTNKSEEKSNEKESNILSSLLGGYASSSDDDEQKEQSDKEKTPNETNQNSTKEITQTTIHDKSSKQQKESIPPSPSNNTSSQNTKSIKKLCHNYTRKGKCHRGSSCPYSHDETARQHHLQQQKTRASSKQNQNSNKKRCSTPKTLLKKLLEREIRRETCLTLQCLRYIVQNDYFMGLTTTVTSSNNNRKEDGNDE